MSKINSFNPAALSSIRADMVAALAAVEAKYGIKIGLGKINYTDSDFTCKMTTMIADTVAEATADGAKVDPKWVADFNRYYLSYGLQASDLGKEFDFQGKKAKLVGSRVRADKQIVIKVQGNDKFNIISAQQAVRMIHG